MGNSYHSFLPAIYLCTHILVLSSSLIKSVGGILTVILFVPNVTLFPALLTAIAVCNMSFLHVLAIVSLHPDTLAYKNAPLKRKATRTRTHRHVPHYVLSLLPGCCQFLTFWSKILIVISTLISKLPSIMDMTKYDMVYEAPTLLAFSCALSRHYQSWRCVLYTSM